MLKNVMTAAVAMGALAFGVPAAVADEPTYDCAFDTVQQEDVTGQNFEGVAWGFAAHVGGAVSIRCFITVNGAEVASTAGSGEASVMAAGAVSFVASDVDDVDICAEVTTSHGVVVECYESTTTQFPPQEVVDLGDDVAFSTDPVICSVPPPGDYPPDIHVDEEGDMYRNGTKIRDCPPYGEEPDPKKKKAKHRGKKPKN